MEVKAPEEHILDETPHEVNFEWQDGTVPIMETVVELTNKATEEKLPQTGEFPIGKVLTGAGILCAGGAVLLGIKSKKKGMKKGKHEE